MTESIPSQDELKEEFRSLGNNLVGALRSAWDSQERKKLQEEVESGLAEVAATLAREAETFKNSPSGQQLKSDLESLGERLRSGEVETAARRELMDVLRKINQELERAVEKWTGQQTDV